MPFGILLWLMLSRRFSAHVDDIALFCLDICYLIPIVVLLYSWARWPLTWLRNRLPPSWLQRGSSQSRFISTSSPFQHSMPLHTSLTATALYSSSFIHRPFAPFLYIGLSYQLYKSACRTIFIHRCSPLLFIHRPFAYKHWRTSLIQYIYKSFAHRPYISLFILPVHLLSYIDDSFVDPMKNWVPYVCMRYNHSAVVFRSLPFTVLPQST